MSDVPILVCDCGKRLRAPGAAPGRVGRCPACGGTLRVAGAFEPPAAALATASVSAPARKPRRKRRAAATAIWDGLLPAPARPETRLRDSLKYPLWGATGVAALVLLPPLFWFSSILLYEGSTALIEGGGSPAGLMGLLIAAPSGVVLLLVGGYALLFLGRVLAASALGESRHPRWPELELGPIVWGLGRWALAAVAAGLVGVGPALLYRMARGGVGPLDVPVLAGLLTVGLDYALMALLASILHEDARAANPVTVIGAIARLGPGQLRPVLVGGAGIGLIAVAAGAIGRVGDPLLARALVYPVWLAALYAVMVTLRVLGLHYARNARALGWFRDRKRWGV